VSAAFPASPTVTQSIVMAWVAASGSEPNATTAKPRRQANRETRVNEIRELIMSKILVST
jgi:hypothetical protein